MTRLRFAFAAQDLLAAKNHIMLTDSLAKKGLLEPRQWAIGHTKVFMRNLQQQKLEEAREIALKDVVKKMQAGARRFICRCRYLRYQAILSGACVIVVVLDIIDDQCVFQSLAKRSRRGPRRHWKQRSRTSQNFLLVDITWRL